MKSFEAPRPAAENETEVLDLDVLYEKAQESLEDEDRIEPSSFADRYKQETIDADERYVREMEARFEASNTPEQERGKKLATVFESAFYRNADLNEWLGPDTSIILASRYDDIKNGVDGIAEFTPEGASASHLAMAIDVTITPALEAKFQRIKNDIDKGELTMVKYFASDHMRGELLNIPRVVIGADADTALEAALLTHKRKNKELAHHWLQFQILEEMDNQLRVFEHYAREKAKQSYVAKIMAQSGSLIRRIREEKSKTLRDPRTRDGVFATMQKHLTMFV